MTFILEVVTESLSHAREYIIPDFKRDSRFNEAWWDSVSVKSPVVFCRFLDNGEEVGRAKILPHSRSYTGYRTWSCPHAGVTEIDRIEIRPDLRRSGKRYGQRAVEQIGHIYGQPIMAMSLDETSDGFWSSLGWTTHVHPDGTGYSILFTSV